MKKFQGALLKWGSLVASLALFVGVSSAQAACCWWFHQPKVPQGMEKFKK
ncbi:MAG: cyclic lactone autoinducer peptide [Eubacteriales bacterium]